MKTNIKNKKTKENIKNDLKAKKQERRAISKLRFLLFRVWVSKNWFTLFIIMAVVLISLTVTGLMPRNLPVIGTFSYALKDSLQRFLEIGDSEFYSIFGSITGIFSLLWSLGYASNKLQAVSYRMLDMTKIQRILLGGGLSLNDKGKIILVEKRMGIDIDGNGKIGVVEPHSLDKSGNSLLSDIVGTFTELSTILSVTDETLKKTIDDNRANVEKNTKPSDDSSVLAKRPTSAFKPNKF